MSANSLSPWGAAAALHLASPPSDLYFAEQNEFAFKLQLAAGSLWIVVQWAGGGRVAFRTAFSPADDLEIKSIKQEDQDMVFTFDCVIGTYTLRFSLPDPMSPLLHYRVSLKPSLPVSVPFWPRDVLFPGNGSPDHTAGKVHVGQVGIRSGMQYISMTRPKAGSLLYFQNLSAINDYFKTTETSAANTVGGFWPELGFSLPANPENPLPPRKQYVISDAFVAFSQEVPGDQFETAKQFVDLLAKVYIHLPKPETEYHHYPEVLDKALRDLHSAGCWNYVNGHPYLNAYLCDYQTPPEVMVQLAVLLPLLDFEKWRGTEKIKIAKDLREGLPEFFDKKLQTMVRWLPAAEEKLDKSEEHKAPNVMDSWYLHHPLLNLSRLAKNGDKDARKLFLTSLDYAIKVARHFKYNWPVFYKIDSLEVIKAETKPGNGGEKDVAGIYAHLMVQAFDLTGDRKFIREAEKAATSLKDHGFDLFYQGNNTAFSAGAMLRLWKETGNELYLNLSYLFMANLFKNVSLWSCQYGYGKNFPTFFSLFPLNDAPYTAVYEEQEAFSAINDFFMHAEGENILPSFSLLLAEFIKYVIHRIVYYYPPMLPKDMLSTEIRTGELDPDLWVAIEDIHDGWEQSGGVGQEVYGSGLAFGIVPRHYIRIKDKSFMISVDYPFSTPLIRGNTLTLSIRGNEKLFCRVMILKGNEEKLPEITLEAERDRKPEPKVVKAGIEYQLLANQKVKISWSGK